MTYFAIMSSTKKFQANLEVSEVLITYVTNRGKVRMTLHIGAGHGNDCQIILILLGYDIFCNILEHKKFKQIWRYQRHYSLKLQTGGMAGVMLHIGAGHRDNNAIFPKPALIRGNLSAMPLSISTY